MEKAKNDLSCHVIKHTVKKIVIECENTRNRLESKIIKRLESPGIFKFYPTCTIDINMFIMPFKCLSYDMCTLADKLIF